MVEWSVPPVGGALAESMAPYVNDSCCCMAVCGSGCVMCVEAERSSWGFRGFVGYVGLGTDWIGGRWYLWGAGDLLDVEIVTG